MADMYREEDRGKSLAIASFLPYLGLALGPIVGGLVTQSVEWQWIFWIMCIFNTEITLLGVVFIRESYTPVLLRRKARAQLGPADTPWNRLFWRDLLSRLSVNLRRPFLLLARRPVIQVIALIMALNFGIYCFMLSTFATLWINQYGQSATTSSLNYIAISVGTTVSAQVGGRIMDLIYRRLRDRDRAGGGGGVGRPEFRVPWMAPGVAMLAAGLFWYGWSAERRAAWARRRRGRRRVRVRQLRRQPGPAGVPAGRVRRARRLGQRRVARPVQPARLRVPRLRARAVRTPGLRVGE